MHILLVIFSPFIVSSDACISLKRPNQREIPGRLVSKEETFALYEEYHTWRHNPLPTNPVESNCVDEYLPFRQVSEIIIVWVNFFNYYY